MIGVPPPPPPQRHPPPTADDRNWAVGAHLSALLAAAVGLTVLGPLVVWLIKKDDHPLVAAHAREALNFNISLMLYGIAIGILALPIAILTVGIGLLVLLPLGLVVMGAWLVLTIVAAVKAFNGQQYRYPLTVRLVR